jgi:hypothetical protein
MPPLRPEQAPTPEDRNPTPPEAEQTPEPTNLPEGTEAPSHAA